MRRSGVRAPPREHFAIFSLIYLTTSGSLFQVARCKTWNARVLLLVQCRGFCLMGWWKQRQQNGLQAEDLFNKDTKIFSCCSTTGSACQEISLWTKLPSCFWLWLCALPKGQFIKSKVNKQALFEIQLWANETKNKVREKLSKDCNKIISDTVGSFHLWRWNKM